MNKGENVISIRTKINHNLFYLLSRTVYAHQTSQIKVEHNHGDIDQYNTRNGNENPVSQLVSRFSEDSSFLRNVNPVCPSYKNRIESHFDHQLYSPKNQYDYQVNNMLNQADINQWNYSSSSDPHQQQQQPQASSHQPNHQQNCHSYDENNIKSATKQSQQQETSPYNIDLSINNSVAGLTTSQYLNDSYTVNNDSGYVSDNLMISLGMQNDYPDHQMIISTSSSSSSNQSSNVTNNNQNMHHLQHPHHQSTNHHPHHNLHNNNNSTSGGLKLYREYFHNLSSEQLVQNFTPLPGKSNDVLLRSVSNYCDDSSTLCDNSSEFIAALTETRQIIS